MLFHVAFHPPLNLAPPLAPAASPAEHGNGHVRACFGLTGWRGADRQMHSRETMDFLLGVLAGPQPSYAQHSS